MDTLYIEPYIIALIVAVGILAIIAIVLIIKKWNSGTIDTRAVVTQLYAIGATILKSLKNDGKISADELEQILTDIQALIAILRGETLDVVQDEFKDSDSAPALTGDEYTTAATTTEQS